MAFKSTCSAIYIVLGLSANPVELILNSI